VKRHSSPYTPLGCLHRAAGKEEGKNGCPKHWRSSQHSSITVHPFFCRTYLTNGWKVRPRSSV
jgi:hypothetical protein